jgi:hypothetical protein
VICVDGSVSLINVYNSSLSGTSELGNGGAFYILNCGSTIINGSNLTGFGTGSSGKGGAIYFGVGTSFVLVDSLFGNCSAQYGGAIYSESEVSGLRQITGVIFTNNSVLSGGNGNDIADNSSIGSTIYNVFSVSNSTSDSTSSDSVWNFYIIQMNISLDCLLSPSGCSQDPTYVSTSGVDSQACGSISSPCHSVSRGLENLIESLDFDAEIIVESGDYTDTLLVVSSTTLVVSTNSADRPVLSLVSPPFGV